MTQVIEKSRDRATSAGSCELTIVMPCLNEAETLATCIRKAQGFLQRSGIDGEVVIGDNGSTDGSQEIARRLGVRVVYAAARGYGAAVYCAAKAARGRYIIMGDADDSYDFSQLEAFVDELRNGVDLVMGNRFRGGISPGAMPWKNRWIGNPVLSGMGRLFFRIPIGDFHCGLRGFSRDAFELMDLRTTGMEFASEMVVKASHLRMTVAEVPTTLSPDGRSRAPHLRPWRDGWRHLRFLLMYSPRWLFLYPGMAMVLAGCVLIALLYLGPIMIGRIGLDVHTMVYATGLVVVGYQAVLFAVFTKVFSIEEGLLPRDPRMDRLMHYLTLETGVVAGVVLLLAGFAGAGLAISDWRAESFGALDPSRTLRFVIPSVLALILGCQTILSSFFLSIMGLRMRRLPSDEDA